jgi:hypothetical protein
MWLRTVRRKAEKQQRKSIALVFRFALVPSRLFWIRSNALLSTTKAGCTKSSATGFCCAAVLRAVYLAGLGGCKALTMLRL